MADDFAGLSAFDDSAIKAVTDLYRRFFPAHSAVLDLMAGWVSHLPPEASYARVVGIGRDERELLENPFLDEWVVQDLNRQPHLSFADGEFDAVAVCLAVQRLTRPVEVFREAGRLVRPGGPIVITFSRCSVAEKGLPCWQMLDEDAHVRVVVGHLTEAANWTEIECRHRCPDGDGEPLYAVIARSLGPVAGCWSAQGDESH